MTVQLLRAELARWTYKPGWRLAIVPAGGTPWASPLLTVDYIADDSRESLSGIRGQVKISSRHEVPSLTVDDLELFGPWLADVLAEVERHEMREWLRRDGDLFDDPHAGSRS